MRLFVEEKVNGRSTGKKHYLAKLASTKKELAELLGKKEFYIDDEKYFVSQVKAEKSQDGAALGMALGGVLGLFGGVPGVLAGGAFGGLLGKDSDIKEVEKVEKFNGSRL
ncbi:hypothetical protein ERW49_08415 [Aliivibrio finisterrensis]|uniref:Uncharacterized protein n=1 Tax=Aliivibrio finisterrensis TaxID=511998 RepID=A0A4Q5KLU5_9GAMM|nr:MULTISPECIES: hypothetical protein [Aliivibrio]MDD9175497.1 hypothetical protein [Aliivibrio sp. S3TY1]MDD9192576.1 hypothetical protein [Aliivibrio sp. S2TY2]MDD9200335.1 hypothetical protein [Aliivibrio sp. S2MY1]RYU46616.1 hypothetical protein ERW49_08415 [Aliivibrio finisterrensis]